MAHWIQACPVEPVNGACPEALVWVYSAPRLYLTWDQFTLLLPAIVGAFFTAWIFRQMVRMIFNNR